MPVTLGVLVALVSLVVITLPFIRRSGAALSARNADELERLTRLRSDLYEQIRQLQADHAANTITDEDYRHQLLELRVGAAETIRLLDRIGHEEEPQDAPELLTRKALEEEIALLRRARFSGHPRADGHTDTDES